MTEPALLVVVAGVVVHEGRVLAARRTRPADAAGRWEFPGGKVEDGESEPDAVVRELAEELAVRVHVRQLLGRVPLSDEYELAAYGCDLTGGTPTPGDTHDAVRWIDLDALDTLDWLPPDLALLPAAASFAAVS